MVLPNNHPPKSITEFNSMHEELFRPLKKGRLSDEIVEYIKELIVSGQLKPSDRLPSERDLAERFNVGRPTIREAIRTLELIGLVEVFPGHKGTSIRNPELDTYMESLREQMSWMIQIERTTLQQLSEVRDGLETRIALLAAERATKRQLKEMQTVLDDMKSCTHDINAYLEKGIEFHSVMARATQNPIFFAIWNAFADLIFKYYRDLLKNLDIKILKKLYQVNVDVFEAILSQDPDQIHQAMSQHIDAEHEILWPE
jgi:GntR family transcriptional repressor for pyruvate dehydrogenase complex